MGYTAHKSICSHTSISPIAPNHPSCSSHLHPPTYNPKPVPFPAGYSTRFRAGLALLMMALNPIVAAPLQSPSPPPTSSSIPSLPAFRTDVLVLSVVDADEGRGGMSTNSWALPLCIVCSRSRRGGSRTGYPKYFCYSFGATNYWLLTKPQARLYHCICH